VEIRAMPPAVAPLPPDAAPRVVPSAEPDDAVPGDPLAEPRQPGRLPRGK
jgi:hypothetical protein